MGYKFLKSSDHSLQRPSTSTIISHMHRLYFVIRLTSSAALFFLPSPPLFFNNFQWVSLCYFYTLTQCILTLFPSHHSLGTIFNITFSICCILYLG
jgi:hypothetical protein